MSYTTVPRMEVRKVVLASDGLLTSGTITPANKAFLPNRIVAADVFNAAAWTFTDVASGETFPVDAGTVRPMPTSGMKDIIFSAGTYKIAFWLDA